LQARASVIATQASVVDLRIQFTKDTTRILNSSADSLTLADMNEEGANLSALSTRQQLAVQALSLANRSDQAILRLF
jgi:flagellin